jgi:tetratricopeptide (TPR) repeat protein
MFIRILFLILIVMTSVFAQPPRTQWFAGRVLMSGGANASPDSAVELVCNGAVQQKAFTDPQGHFNMIVDDSRSAIPGASWRGDQSQDLPLEFTHQNCEIHISSSFCRPAVIRLEPSDNDQYLRVGTVILECPGIASAPTVSMSDLRTPDKARRLREKAERARRIGKLAEARRLISEALIKYPGFAAGWLELGRIDLDFGNRDLARSAFQRAAALQHSGSGSLPKTQNVQK